MGLSPLITKVLTDFMTEPDARNVEYATEPSVCYKGLLFELLHNRMRLRKLLKELGPEMDEDLTIIPGSCISHEFDQKFMFSDPDNPYYKIIRDRYQTSIVTTSLHLNFGVANSAEAIDLSNAVRLIASQALAISASSPFHNGKDTGYQSYRWHTFPQTPDYVPIFKDHESFIIWNEEKIKSGEMFNVRHLWCSTRANGPTRPVVLNRVEMRIPDLILNVCSILGLTTYFECRLLDWLKNGTPKILQTQDMDLAQVLDDNEASVAKDGFNAKIFDFETESEMLISKQIQRDYEKYTSLAKNLEVLEPYQKLDDIFENGNVASRMLKEFQAGKNIRDILIDKAIEQEEIDNQMYKEGELVANCY